MAADSPEPPMAVGSALSPVVLGPPIDGLVAIWDEANHRSLWKVDDPEGLAALLGRGVTARTETDPGRFREVGLMDPSQRSLLIPERWKNPEGDVDGHLFDLEPAEAPEPTAQDFITFRTWMMEVLESAARRGDFVVIELGGWSPPRRPYVFAMAHRDGDDRWISAVETSPPVTDSNLWVPPERGADGTTMTAPATIETLRAAALLVADAAPRWVQSPHELGVTFGAATSGPFPDDSQTSTCHDDPMATRASDATGNPAADPAATAAEPDRDRARGALLGLACGDAVGTTVEFQAPGTFTPVTDMIGGGPFGLEAGEWTDDTSMALCLAESIIDTNSLDLADQLRRYVLWHRQGYLASNGRCFDIGNTTRSQLRRFEKTGDPIDPSPNEEAAANGSLMRLAPVPIAWHRDLEAAASRSGESSRSTHPAQRPVDTCRLLGAMVAALIAGTPADEVFSPTFWQWGTLHPQVASIADGSYRTKEPPQIRGSGFCIDALEAALWAVAGATDLRDAILRAVNLGDDADTTAAIAGQLAGARWGASAIPEDWMAKLALRDRIRSLADSLFDLDTDPSPVAARWRYDDAIHAWWVEPGSILAGEYPTNRSGDGHKIDLLLDAGIRTFVDLTTPQDRLTPYRDQLKAKAGRRGLAVRHESRPIPDQSVTAMADYLATVDLIRSEVAEGRPTYIHCWGGVGRTATVVGCLIADTHGTTDAVLNTIASLRAGTRKAHRRAPENHRQDQIISTWIERRSSA